MFTDIFVNRPKFAFVISIVISIIGCICVFKLPIAEYPEIAPPTVKVTARYPGATSQMLSDTVAAVIEEQVNGIDDLLYFKSESDNNGNYTLTLTFKPGINSDIAQVNVQNAVQRAEAQLPAIVKQIGVVTAKQSTDMAGVFSFQTDGSVLSHLELSNYVRMNIKDAFARLPGLGSVEVLGERNYSMRIWLDPLKMNAMNLTPEAVIGALKSQNADAAAGTVGGEKANKYIQFKLDLTSRLKTVEEFAEIIIANNDGRQVKLGDIARIELGSERYTEEGSLNGKQSIALALYRQDGANAVQLVRDATEMLADLQKRFPKGVTVDHTYDPSNYIMVNVKEIATTLIATLVLVVAITYVFLQSWRATVVPMLAIPVSLLGTFFFMMLMGYSINVLTLFGLILVIGSLVDNAIVIVENTMRIMQEERLPAKEATSKSMKQVTGPVIATTLVSAAIYAPIGFYGGIVGTIYLQFAVTMCVALCISAVNALTLSPALCALILKLEDPNKKKNFFFRSFDWVLDKFKGGYLGFSRFMIRRAWLTILLLLAVLAAFFYLLKIAPGGFLPDEDKGNLMCEIELPQGAALNLTEKALKEFTEKTLKVPGVEKMITVAGFSIMSGSGENIGFAIVDLDDWSKRNSKDLSIHAIRDKIEAQGRTIPGAVVSVFQPPAIMGLGNTGGITFAFRNMTGESPTEFEPHVGKLMGILNNKELFPDVMYAYTTFNARTPQLFLDIDRQKAEALGVPIGNVFSALQSNLASLYVNDFNLYGYSFKVQLQLDLEDRSDISDLEELLVQNNKGELVPLNSFCEIKVALGSRKLERFNQNMCASFTVMPKRGASTGDIMNRIEAITAKEFSNSYAVSWTDMSYQEKNNDGRLVVLMMLAVLFGYLFLVAQYESWTVPIPVILSVAFAGLGGAIALYVKGLLMDIYAQLGLIMLIGLCAKSTILMVEFSMQERKIGKSVARSALNGANYRYRAVLMTAWSFIIGVLPLLFASGAGAESRKIIGITSFWGMVCATFLGVAFIPPMYVIFQKMREKVNGKKG
ncbi:MAG: efflux RND transporter permease subunit [Lentisphaeria bacterium]|nr:efflux RND transporter permease subunit [Lentisphaeria bacterium]